MGTHVHPWLIHVNVWQNQYSIVKQNKVKIKIKKTQIKNKNRKYFQKKYWILSGKTKGTNTGSEYKLCLETIQRSKENYQRDRS